MAEVEAGSSPPGQAKQTTLHGPPGAWPYGRDEGGGSMTRAVTLRKGHEHLLE